MCLEVKKPEIIVAKEDMVCYKVMMEHYGDKGAWVSPYQGMAYKEGRAYELEKQLQLLDSKFGNIKDYPYIVEEGFHSFANLSDALQFLNVYEARCPWCMDASRHAYVIVKCIIPKGTTYAEGLFFDWGNKFHSFCSEKIICEGKIENE